MALSAGSVHAASTCGFALMSTGLFGFAVVYASAHRVRFGHVGSLWHA